MVTSVPWQLHSSQAKNLERLDATLSRGPARGPRGPRTPKVGGSPVSSAPTPPAPEPVDHP
jgi:hypothetical protein